MAKSNAPRIEKLTDPILLAQIATGNEYNDGVRCAAALGALDNIAAPRGSILFRCCEIARLSDQSLLATLAVQDKEDTIRRAALAKLTDQVLLAQVAERSAWLETSFAAIEKLIDQTVAGRLTAGNSRAAIRQASARRIVSDRFLIERLAAEPSPAVRAAIVETLHESASLRAVALTAFHEVDRLQALERLRTAFNDPASDVAAGHVSLTARMRALEAETNADKLAHYALAGEFDVERRAAAQSLNDPAAVEETALRSHDSEVLSLLLAKIGDNAALRRIAGRTDDAAMRLAAAQKAGARSWTDIFAATSTGSGPETLADAIGAVALFPAVQREAIDGVQLACLSLIRRGDESRIAELAEMLQTYGDQKLAEDYLNCGQPDLEAAAKQWATRSSYRIGRGQYGSNRARWGSRR